MNTEDPITEPKMKPTPVQPPMMRVAKAVDVRDPWICKQCGAIMGSVIHERAHHGHYTFARLILFRGAVYINELLPANYIFGKVDAGEFGCSRCGTVRPWTPTAEALRYLSDSRQPIRKKNRNL